MMFSQFCQTTPFETGSDACGAAGATAAAGSAASAAGGGGGGGHGGAAAPAAGKRGRSYQACSAVDSAVVAIGHLFSFDMEHTAPFILNRSAAKAHCPIVLGNVQSTYQPRRWGFMYIDALHESI